MGNDSIQKYLFQNMLGNSAVSHRSDVEPEWFSSFAENLVNSKTVDAKMDDANGVFANRHHTVESMVAELKERVGLSKIHKSASLASNLSEEDAEILAEIKDAIDALFSSHYGKISTPGIIDELSEVFGKDVVLKFEDVIDSCIAENKKMYEHLEPNHKGVFSKSPSPASTFHNEPVFEHVGNL